MGSRRSHSSLDPSIPPLEPSFAPSYGAPNPEPEHIQKLISHLSLQPHVEGGYFVETDRDALRVPNPFTSVDTEALDGTRSASTSIHYLLSPGNPLGAFHRNKGRTVHTLHHGRGRYVIIHADEAAAPHLPGGYGSDKSNLPEHERWAGKARVEVFVVGTDILKGERVQWIVEGGKYKSSFLLPDEEGGGESAGLLISETVVPGFEYDDHDFMKAERMKALVSEAQADEMGWMLRKENIE
ncbi:hypothetical protein K431DRAFT_231776 [Polychaeton citri CBS 116435]|uniref:DUF985 domain-containing protein n=1 Tax=Polychaeton citri CBS 116435 TaxID=1314669 RepID=A0A9P4Q1X8_9PEZI|nr:hypothetical protein K431DRAFT_231776 [Polychaeton citri CBS 116435]